MPEEKKPFDKYAYDTAYRAEHYARLYIHLPKAEKNRLKAHTENRGESINAFIKRAISEQICRDTEE